MSSVVDCIKNYLLRVFVTWISFSFVATVVFLVRGGLENIYFLMWRLLVEEGEVIEVGVKMRCQ